MNMWWSIWDWLIGLLGGTIRLSALVEESGVLQIPMTEINALPI